MILFQTIFPAEYIEDMIRQGIEFEKRKTQEELFAEYGRNLWRELFLSILSEEELADWEARLPKYTCDCEGSYKEWKAKNPPQFPLQPIWKYNLKAAINEKLKRPNISFEAACKQWNWA
jgi:hypothetical protein